MKIYLTRNDVIEILARHFDLPIQDVSSPAEPQTILVRDELYWEGNEEKKGEN